jgi:hypothetical protein
MKKVLVVILSALFISGCAEYYVAHERFSASQGMAIQASSKMLVETKTTYPDGTVVEKKEIGNPMAAWAATQMAPPIEPGFTAWNTLKAAFPWAFGVWAVQGIQNIATSNKGATTNVTGNQNLTGNQAGQGVGIPTTTTTTSTQVLP